MCLCVYWNNAVWLWLVIFFVVLARLVLFSLKKTRRRVSWTWWSFDASHIYILNLVILNNTIIYNGKYYKYYLNLKFQLNNKVKSSSNCCGKGDSTKKRRKTLYYLALKIQWWCSCHNRSLIIEKVMCVCVCLKMRARNQVSIVIRRHIRP